MIDYQPGDYVKSIVKPAGKVLLCTGWEPVTNPLYFCGFHKVNQCGILWIDDNCPRLKVFLSGYGEPKKGIGWTACAFRKFHGPEEEALGLTKKKELEDA